MADALRETALEERQEAIAEALSTIEEQERRPEMLARLHELSTSDLERPLQAQLMTHEPSPRNKSKPGRPAHEAIARGRDHRRDLHGHGTPRR